MLKYIGGRCEWITWKFVLMDHYSRDRHREGRSSDVCRSTSKCRWLCLRTLLAGGFHLVTEQQPAGRSDFVMPIRTVGRQGGETLILSESVRLAHRNPKTSFPKSGSVSQPTNLPASTALLDLIKTIHSQRRDPLLLRNTLNQSQEIMSESLRRSTRRLKKRGSYTVGDIVEVS